MEEKLKQKLIEWIDSAQYQADFYKENGLVSSEAETQKVLDHYEFTLHNASIEWTGE